MVYAYPTRMNFAINTPAHKKSSRTNDSIKKYYDSHNISIKKNENGELVAKINKINP